MSMKRVLTAFVLLAGASLGPSGCGSAPPPCVCPCAEGVGAGAAPEAEAPADDAWAGGEDTSGVQRFAVPVTAEQPSQGPADALVTMVVFSDFQCPFCARLNPTVEQLMRAYPTQLRVVWRNLPLAFHPNAMPAAEAAMEAFAQGGDRAFWQMHDLLFEHQRDLTRETLDRLAAQVGLDTQRFQAAMDSHAHQDAIEADMALAEQIGAQGTPNSFLNGVQVTGAQPYESFVEVMDAELAHAQRLVRAGTPQGEVYAAVTRDGLTEVPPPPDAPEPEYPAPAQPDPAAVYRVPLDGRLPQRGPSNALVTVVVFSDFQCPFCSRVEPTFTRLLDTYGRDLRVVWMNNPLAFHQNALPAAIAAMEAFQQGGDEMFWALHGKLFENSNDLTRETIERLAQEVGLDMGQLRAALDQREHEQVILAQQALAVSLGAAGTPSSFINGRNLRGAQPYEAFVVVVEEELAKARALVARGTPRARVYAQTIRDGATTQQMLPTTASGDEAAAANPRIELPVPRSAPSRGPARATVVIQEVGDFQCPFCSRVQPTIAQLLQDYDGRVRLVWRDMPLPFHPNAHIAAQAAREVFRQGGNTAFWAYISLLFVNQQDLSRDMLERLAQEVTGVNMAQFRQALDTERHRAAVDADSAAVQAAGITGTPGFVINGEHVSGAVPYEQLAAAVERALAEADAR
ncbi:MAG: thioredoxin domain-containing protein [Sandaracinaceae bacterium]|jgi:protein-disulfide isomerase|nr:thioredoxin domain-containing protein [Sandaracinaceae bacterium]